MKIQFQLTSLKDKEKSKNGDACHFFEISNPNIKVFLVADGVGSCVGDYKASEVTVTKFEEIFSNHFYSNNFTNYSLEDIIKTTILDINKFILETEGYYKGMKSTLIVSVLDMSNDKMYYASIGDSRIYKIDNNQILLLTKDQVKTVMRRKQDGTLLTQNGSVINASGVTNLLGIYNIDIEIHAINIDKTTSFLMATDGFYDCLSENKMELQKLHNEYYFRNDFLLIVNSISQKQKDDATAIFFKILHVKDSKFIKKQQDVFNKLKTAIQEHHASNALACLKQIEDEDLKNSFEFYNKLIREMFQSKFDNATIYQKLVELLKKSRI